MKKLFTLLFSVLTLGNVSYGQNNIGINTATPDASAALDVSSTTQGMLVPRMSKAQRDLINLVSGVSTPATGLLIYQTDDTPGFYSYSGSSWSALGSNSFPAQTGNGGKYLTTNGTSASWGNAPQVSMQLFVKSTNAQTRPIYAYGRYTFNFNDVVVQSSSGSWNNNNSYTVPTGSGGIFQINTGLLMTAYSTTTVPVIAPEIEVTSEGSTIVYYGVGSSASLFQGAQTDNTAGAGSGATGAPYSYGRGNSNILLPLKAGDTVKIYYRFSNQSTTASQTISFSTDGSSYLSIVKLN